MSLLNISCKNKDKDIKITTKVTKGVALICCLATFFQKWILFLKSSQARFYLVFHVMFRGNRVVKQFLCCDFRQFASKGIRSYYNE